MNLHEVTWKKIDDFPQEKSTLERVTHALDRSLRERQNILEYSRLEYVIVTR